MSAAAALRGSGWSLLAVVLGAAVTVIAVGTPGSVPLLLGLAVPARFATRRQPIWALLAGLAVGVATGQPWLAGYCLGVTLICLLLARRSLLQRLLLTPLLALPVAALALGLNPPLAPWSAALALLCLNALLAQLANHLLFDRPRHAAERRLPPLHRVLTGGFTLALAPGLFIGLLLVGQWHWSGQAREQLAQTARSNAQMRTYVEEHVGEHLRAVAQAADDASATGAAPSLVGLRKRLRGFLTLLVTDPNGRVIDFHAPGVTAMPGPVDDREYFLRPKASGLPFVSGVFKGRGFGSDLLVAVSAPYFDAQGGFLGVVEGSLSLQAMAGRLQEMAEGAGVDLLLRDVQGRVVVSSLAQVEIAAPVELGLLTPAPVPSRLSLNAGGDHFLVEQPVAGLGWSMATLRPLAPLAGQQTLGHLLLGLACLTGLAVINALGNRFGRALSGPLEQLLTHIRAIDLEHPASLQPVALEARFVELAELHHDFNAMLGRLSELDRGLRAALEAQAELNRELEQRVARRTEDLHDALGKARQLAEAKSTFLANMSHELRTPLTSILGYADLALEPGSSRQAVDEALHTIRRQGDHLLAVVNDVLDAGRIESGSLRVESTAVALDALLRDLGDMFAERARERGIALRIAADPGLPAALLADPLRLRQVLINLLGNAIKFTPQGSAELRARRCLGALVFSVRDTGIGLDREERARLFQPFSQADLTTTRRFGGSGLGLFISRRLCEAMGGRLIVHGRPGQGSRFAVLFPLSLACAAPPAAPSGSGIEALPQLQGRVLVADDVEDLRRLVVTLVAATGVEVREAGNGREALELATRWTPDLVLMDMHMPLLDGMQATRQLREQGARMPIVALTADVLAEDRRRFLDAGCDEVLHKPIRRDALHEVLRQHLAPSARGPAAAAITRLPSGLADLQQGYALRLPGELTALLALQRSDDLPGLLEKLHTLKGTAGTFGFAEVSTAAAALEAQLKRAERERAVEAACLERLQQALRHAAAQHGAASTDSVTLQA